MICLRSGKFGLGPFNAVSGAEQLTYADRRRGLLANLANGGLAVSYARARAVLVRGTTFSGEGMM